MAPVFCLFGVFCFVLTFMVDGPEKLFLLSPLVLVLMAKILSELNNILTVQIF